MSPDPGTLHPVAGQDRVVFLKPLVRSPKIEIGDFTYYDHPERATEFETDAVLYAFGPERLVIGRYCAIAAGVRFLMGGANHADLGPSTFPFGIFAGDDGVGRDVGGNPARVVRRRYEDADVERLLAAAWWDWPAETVTAHAREIMAADPARLEEIAAGLRT